MPNWTENNIKASFATREEAERFLEKHFVDNGNGEVVFDYDTIIPSPKSPDGLDRKYIATRESHIELEEGREWFDWYRWNIDFWGVKWNACDICVGSIYEEDGRYCIAFSFNSPWCSPFPVMEKMFGMHKEARFSYEWIEEQGTEYLGRLEAENGSIVSEDIPEPGSKEAYEMMFEMWGNAEDYRLVDGRYEMA